MYSFDSSLLSNALVVRALVNPEPEANGYFCSLDLLTLNCERRGSAAPQTLIHVSLIERRRGPGRIPRIEVTSKTWGWGTGSDWIHDGLNPIEQLWREIDDGIRLNIDDHYFALGDQRGFRYDFRDGWLPFPLTHPYLGKHYGAVRIKIAQPKFIPGDNVNRKVIAARFEGFLQDIDNRWAKLDL
jgi:hypothetical protein